MNEILDDYQIVFRLNTPDTLTRDNACQLLECHHGAKASPDQYPKKVKEEAVALVREQGYSVAEAAKLPGVATNLRCRWKDHQKQALSNIK